MNFSSFPTEENVVAAAKIMLSILTTCLSLYVTTYQTKQSQREATNFLELRGQGSKKKNIKAVKIEWTNHELQKNTDKAAAKGLARLAVVNDSEM